MTGREFLNGLRDRDQADGDFKDGPHGRDMWHSEFVNGFLGHDMTIRQFMSSLLGCNMAFGEFQGGLHDQGRQFTGGHFAIAGKTRGSYLVSLAVTWGNISS